jgi:lipopolysaccharide export system permease protein
MKLLDKYIAKSVLASVILVTLMLVGLQIFILFVNQLDDIGRANFGIAQSALFVLLQLPYQVYLFFPMACLLGTLIGLGMLANNRELIVMRASGMSISQITIAVMKVAVFLIFIVTFLGETWIPKLSFLSNNIKLQALSGGQTLRTIQGVWVRSGNNFINIGEILPNKILENVYQVSFDENYVMKQTLSIKRVEYINGIWRATDIAETKIYPDHTEAFTKRNGIWELPINLSILKLGNKPDEMTLPELKKFIKVQDRNHQSASNYQLEYWQRMIQPITTLVMILLAIPFIFGPLRSSSMGSKLIVGATVGFSFHIMNKFLAPLSQVLQWPPFLAALGPTLIFAFLGIYLMRRVK